MLRQKVLWVSIFIIISSQIWLASCAKPATVTAPTTPTAIVTPLTTPVVTPGPVVTPVATLAPPPVATPIVTPPPVISSTPRPTSSPATPETPSLPDLQPYVIPAWTQPIIVGDAKTVLQQTAKAEDTQIYIGGSLTNRGKTEAPPFEVKLFIDNKEASRWQLQSLAASRTRYFWVPLDTVVRRLGLSAGKHKFEMVIDPDSKLEEISKENNRFNIEFDLPTAMIAAIPTVTPGRTPAPQPTVTPIPTSRPALATPTPRPTTAPTPTPVPIALPQGEKLTGPYHSLNGIQFLDAQNCIAVGEFGNILRTENGGVTWNRLPEVIGNALMGLSFPTAKNGWAVGTSGAILLTDDGGKTWRTQISGVRSMLNDVFFINERKGWAVGESGTIIRTEDGGVTWIVAPSGVSEVLNAVFFTGENTGFAVGGKYQSEGGGGTLLTTLDGGKTWESKRLSDYILYDIFFIDSRLGWAVGDLGMIHHTFDGGKTWGRMNGGVNDLLRTVFFKDVKAGWISTLAGDILHTINGGVEWKKVSPGLNRGTYLKAMVTKAEPNGPPTIWGAGMTGVILKSSDSGVTWSLQIPEQMGDLYQIGFVGSRSVWASGSAGRRGYFTDDGGRTWTGRDSGRYSGRSMSFVDENRGWSVGDWGTMARTTDGGKSWFTVSPEDEKAPHFRDVFFLAGGKQGFAVGDPHGIEPAYSLYLTSNGGDSWSKQSLPPGSALNAITFAGDKYGWAVGDKGTVAYSYDGGKVWQLQQNAVKDNLRSIFFINEKLGWIVGDNGLVMYTKDGGGLWEAKSIGARTSALYDVLFVDEKRGFIVGSGGKVFYTGDGGGFWVALSPLVSQNIYSLVYAKGDEVWAAGSQGVVLKYRLPK